MPGNLSSDPAELPSSRSVEKSGTGGPPLVSIVIPTFNYVGFLSEAIDSALDQDYPRIEVVVIDDGSTDGTGDLVRKNYGERIRYIAQENQGLSASRNSGIRESRGEMIVCLDADDRLEVSMVSRCVEAFDRLPPEYGVVGTQHSLMSVDGEELPSPYKLIGSDTDVSALDLLVMNRFVCSALVKRDVYEKCGAFDSELLASEDREMWIRAAMQFRLHRLSENLIWVRRHGTNMSRDGNRQADAILRMLRKSRRIGPLRGVRKIYWAKVYSMACYQNAWLYFKYSRFKALTNLVYSLILWPYFSDWRELAQRHPLFRLRALVAMAKGDTQATVRKEPEADT